MCRWLLLLLLAGDSGGSGGRGIRGSTARKGFKTKSAQEERGAGVGESIRVLLCGGSSGRLSHEVFVQQLEVTVQQLPSLQTDW